MWKIQWQPLPAVPPHPFQLGVLQGSTSATSEGPLPYPLSVCLGWQGRCGGAACRARRAGATQLREISQGSSAFPSPFRVAPSTIPGSVLPKHTHRGLSGSFAHLPSAATGTKAGFIISSVLEPSHAQPGVGPSHRAPWKCLHTDFQTPHHSSLHTLTLSCLIYNLNV